MNDSIYENGEYTLKIGSNAKGTVYRNDKLLFTGDSRMAINLFCSNCSNEKLRIKLKKYKYINIWD